MCVKPPLLYRDVRRDRALVGGVYARILYRQKTSISYTHAKPYDFPFLITGSTIFDRFLAAPFLIVPLLLRPISWAEFIFS